MAVIQYYILVTTYLAKTLVKMIPATPVLIEDTDIDESESNDVRCVHIVIHDIILFIQVCKPVCVCVCVHACV